MGNKHTGTTKKQLVQKQYKTLLLGTGSSGKSTVFNSIQCIYHDLPFPEKSLLLESVHIIRQNCVMGIITLLKKSAELYDANPALKCCIDLLNNDYLVEQVKFIVKYGNETFTEAIDIVEVAKLGKSIKYIWNLDEIQVTYKYVYKFPLGFSFPDNIDFFLNKVEDIMKSDYICSKDDLLKLRCRTTGAICNTFSISDCLFNIYHFGGQRNERKKWVHHFIGVSCVIYTFALHFYCKVLFEDEKRNAMEEAIDLLEEIVCSKYFKRTEIIVLLTMPDLFRKTLMLSPLSVCFGDEYVGRNFNDFQATRRITHSLILKLLDMDNDNDNPRIIPIDVINIVSKYIDFYESWLDLVYCDGVQFIQNKLLKVAAKRTNRHIHIFVVNAVKPDEVRVTMHGICEIMKRSKRFTATDGLY